MGKIRFSPALPGIKRQLFDCAPPGHLFKFLVTYKRAFWREHKQSGEIVSTGRSDIPGEVCTSMIRYIYLDIDTSNFAYIRCNNK
jgi:monoamine oxidase